MNQARFHCIAGRRVRNVSSPAWPGQDQAGLPDGPWYAWRLLGRNNREVGRSPCVHSRSESCHRALDELCSRAGDLVPTLIADAGTGRWGWRLDLEGVPVAVSARRYFRQREGLYAVTQFLALLPEALATEASGELSCGHRTANA